MSNRPSSGHGRSGNRKEVRPGIRRDLLPESTPVPNFFFDKLMPLFPHAQFKVLLFLWRKTVGWQKERDILSLSQIERGAGVCRDVAISGVRLLQELGLFTKNSTSHYRGSNEFKIIADYEKQQVIGQLERLVERNDQSARPSPTSRFSRGSLVDLADTQKATTKKANKEKGKMNSFSYKGEEDESKFDDIPVL
jgi:hypothetical protein